MRIPSPTRIPGNGVFASLGNLIENPAIRMIFLEFEQSTVGLYANGEAHIFSPGKIQSLTNAPLGHDRSHSGNCRASFGNLDSRRGR